MPAEDVTVTANFAEIPTYELTMAADPVEGGTAADDTGNSPYAAGTVVDISAVANEGYEFVNWTAPAGTFGDANLEATTFTMPAEDVTVTANFECDVEAAQAALAADKSALITSMIGSGNPSSRPTVTRTLYTTGSNGSSITWGPVITASGTCAATISDSTLTLNFPTSCTSERVSTLTANLENECGVTGAVTFTITTARTRTCFMNRHYPWSIVEED